MAKYLDYDGLKKVWAKIKTVDSSGNITGGLAYTLMNYADTSASSAVSVFQNGTYKTDMDSVKGNINTIYGYFSSGIAKKATADGNGNNIANTYATKTELSNYTGSAKIVSVGTITTGTWHGSAIADGYIASASKWNGKQDKLTFDSSPTSGSSNPVTSNGIYSAIEAVKTTAEGKTSSYAISTSAVTGYENAAFNIAKTNGTAEIKITITSAKIKDIGGRDVSLSNLKIGDIIYTTTKNVKDWWYAGKKATDSGVYYFDFLELDADSPDLSNYVTNGTFNSLKNSLGAAAYKGVTTSVTESDSLPTSNAVKAYADRISRDLGTDLDHAINGISQGTNNGETKFTTIGGDSSTACIVKGLNNAAYYDVVSSITGTTTKLPTEMAVVNYINGLNLAKKTDIKTYTLATGTANGTVKFNETDVAVKGLASSAYKSYSTAVVSQSEPNGTANLVTGSAVVSYCSGRYVLTSSIASISEDEINAICV